MALRRLCDKLKVKCPKCEYITERALLADHLAKCGQEESPQRGRTRNLRSEKNYEKGRSKSRDNALNPKRSPIKWHRSRDALDQETGFIVESVKIVVGKISTL